MELEDNMSYILREKGKCQQRMLEAEELKYMLQVEKDRWERGVLE